MRAGKVIAVAAMVAVSAGTAYAEDVAPSDVKFADNSVSESLTGKPGDASAGATPASGLERMTRWLSRP